MAVRKQFSTRVCPAASGSPYGASSLRAREGPAHLLKGQRRRTEAETAGFVQTLRQPRWRSVGRVCAADEGLETRRALYSSSSHIPLAADIMNVVDYPRRILCVFVLVAFRSHGA